jgi:uncharacterized OsmC-like protein
VSGAIRVEHKENDLFAISVRNHILNTDQPTEAGGSDLAPTPTELFVVSLASCVAYYARRFLARHSLPSDGLSVVTTYSMAERPTRVSEIQVSIHLPAEIPEDAHARLLAVASHCTVHNTLANPPRVTIALSQVHQEAVLT